MNFLCRTQRPVSNNAFGTSCTSLTITELPLRKVYHERDPMTIAHAANMSREQEDSALILPREALWCVERVYANNKSPTKTFGALGLIQRAWILSLCWKCPDVGLPRNPAKDHPKFVGLATLGKLAHPLLSPPPYSAFLDGLGQRGPIGSHPEGEPNVWICGVHNGSYPRICIVFNWSSVQFGCSRATQDLAEGRGVAAEEISGRGVSRSDRMDKLLEGINCTPALSTKIFESLSGSI